MRARWKFHISSSLGSRDAVVLLRHLDWFIFSKHSPNSWFSTLKDRPFEVRPCLFQPNNIRHIRWKGVQVLNWPACDVASNENINYIVKYDVFKFQYIIQSLCALFSSKVAMKSFLNIQPINWFKSTQTLRMDSRSILNLFQASRCEQETIKEVVNPNSLLWLKNFGRRLWRSVWKGVGDGKEEWTTGRRER